MVQNVLPGPRIKQMTDKKDWQIPCAFATTHHTGEQFYLCGRRRASRPLRELRQADWKEEEEEEEEEDRD